MVEGPHELSKIPFREGTRQNGPELRNELRVVRTVETQVREEPRKRGFDRGRAFLALVVAVAVVTGALIINLTLREEPNQRPSASMRPERSLVFPGEPVFFDGSESDDPDGSLVRFEWRFLPGGLCETARPVITRSFGLPGLYNVSLRVEDDRGEVSNYSRVLIVVVPRPTVSAFDALTFSELVFRSGAVALAGAPVGFFWNFSDRTPEATGPVVLHAFADGGNFTVRFEARYGGERLAASLKVNITNRAPVAYYNITEPGPFYTNHRWTFDGSRSSDQDGSVVGWSWEFGDGTTDTINGSVVGHSFSRSGAFRVVLRILDDDGAGASMSRDIPVMKDLVVVLASAETYTDPSGAPRANVTVIFDNPGDPKPAGAVRVSVTAHTPAQNDIDDPESSLAEFYGADVAAGAGGLSIRVDGLLISSYLPEKTWYLIELGYLSSVVDSRWYQKY